MAVSEWPMLAWPKWLAISRWQREQAALPTYSAAAAVAGGFFFGFEAARQGRAARSSRDTSA
jgi:hypothetical protein